MSKFLKRKLHAKSPETPTLQSPPPSAPTVPANSFLHVPLGSGGTFTSPSSPIGTSACLNTVGVFFEISSSKAFCAHIDAFVTKPLTPMFEGGPSRKWYGTDFLSTPKIREEVFRRLEKESRDGSWPAEGRDKMRKTLVLSCRKMYAPAESTTQVAEVVVKAIMEWLGVAQSDVVIRKGAAFFVKWPGGSAKEFEDGVEGLTAVDAEVGEGEWTFGIEEKAKEEVEGNESEW